MEQQLNYRKVKLIKSLEILQMQTNPKSSLTTNQHRSKLANIGIPCDRRTLSQDIDDDIDDKEDIKARESFSP